MIRAVVALLLALLPAAAPARAEPPIIIKFSHVSAPQAHKSRAALKFKELAEKYTNGRVKIELYPNSQLYKDKEELEALQLGAVQMLAPSLSKFGPLGLKEFEVFDLPYLFRDYDQLAKVTPRSCWLVSKPRASLASPTGTTASRCCRRTGR